MDMDTFLTTLYVMADDFCKTQPVICKPGPRASLSHSEILTLAVFGQWAEFRSERSFFRYALRNLIGALGLSNKVPRPSYEWTAGMVSLRTCYGSLA